jgi:hypothetical protein
VAAISYEVHTLRANKLDHTLTRTTRRAFRTHHPIGKALFTMGFGSFAVWFICHINEADYPIDRLLDRLKKE